MEDEFLKIIFVKLEENYSDRFTKNTSMEVYEKHHGEYVANRSYIGDTDQKQL